MTHRECEEKLLALTREAYEAFKEFSPDGYHLSLFASEDGCCVVGYVPREDDDGVEMVVDCYMSPEGVYRFSREGDDD